MEQLCIASFIKNGHKFHLYAYDEIKNAPLGAVLKDAGELVSKDRLFKYKDRDTYAGFSNLFRYKLLLERGNYWVDTDVICLKPFDGNSDYVFARSKGGRGTGEPSQPYWTESCVIKAPLGSSAMEYCYDKCSRVNKAEVKFGEIGPYLLNSAIERYGLESCITHAETFCPVDYTNWTKLISGERKISVIEQARMILYRSKGVHFWHEMWRVNGIDKNGIFPDTCIYERLKKRYLAHD
jgi:hypothetical protein